MNNGDGLRVVLWLSGCNHRCKGCQNPQTWDTNSGIPFDEKAEDELFRELNKDYISGLTLSGGDPLHENNLDGVLNLINKIRLLCPNKTIWLYTGYEAKLSSLTHVEAGDDYKIKKQYLFTSQPCGKALLNIRRSQIMSDVDVLVDGRYIEEQRDISLKWCGSSNQRVIDVKKSLEQGEIVLYCY